MFFISFNPYKNHIFIMYSVLFFIECATLAFDAYLFNLFYELYKSGKTCLKSLKEARSFEINSDLPRKVESSGGVVPYAVISGNVKALSSSLRSQYFSSVRGVIQEKIMRRMWDPLGNNIHHFVSSVPFAVCGRTSGLFRKEIYVEIVNPLMAEELTLPTVHEDCTFSFHGESLVVFEVENMLMEDSTLTAVGKLIIDKGKVKIMPPDPGLNYFVTPLTLDSLTKKVSDSARFHKIICIITGVIGLCLLACIAKRGFAEIKQQINQVKRLKEIEEARYRRMIAHRHDNCSKCIVCVENPVEILIAECRHACLCLNCYQMVGELCPVCRSKIITFLPFLLP